jgi:hypothetical protein
MCLMTVESVKSGTTFHATINTVHDGSGGNVSKSIVTKNASSASGDVYAFDVRTPVKAPPSAVHVHAQE